MSKAAMNLQDSFLNQVRRENTEVKVLLVNGAILRGTVKGFDNFTVIINNRNGQHLVYKHAIAQLVSHRPGGPREGGHGGGMGEASHDGAASDPVVESAPSAPASAAPQQGNQGQRSKQRKDGFNTLDLSHVRISENQEAKVDSQ